MDALRSKASQLEEDLESAQSQRKILQMKLEENRVKHENNIKQMNNELAVLRTRVSDQKIECEFISNYRLDLWRKPSHI